MKFIEIIGGLLQPVSNEENIVVERVRGYGKPMPKSVLNYRDRELARMLVIKGVLTRTLIDDKIHFLINGLDDVWEN